jgi:hypothetical protein
MEKLLQWKEDDIKKNKQMVEEAHASVIKFVSLRDSFFL